MATLHIKTVQSLDTPELALYLTLRRVDEHERAGVLVATNAKVVRRLLASRFLLKIHDLFDPHHEPAVNFVMLKTSSMVKPPRRAWWLRLFANAITPAHRLNPECRV